MIVSFAKHANTARRQTSGVLKLWHIADPLAQILETNGQDTKGIEGHQRDPKAIKRMEKQIPKQRTAEVQSDPADAELQWSFYAAAE